MLCQKAYPATKHGGDRKSEKSLSSRHDSDLPEGIRKSPSSRHEGDLPDGISKAMSSRDDIAFMSLGKQLSLRDDNCGLPAFTVSASILPANNCRGVTTVSKVAHLHASPSPPLSLSSSMYRSNLSSGTFATFCQRVELLLLIPS